MTQLIRIVIIIALLSISSCGVMQTPYAPKGYLGGYSEIALNKNTYKVTFDGNSNTSSEMVQNFTIRRAAELTQKNDYKYFIIVSSHTNNHVFFTNTPATVTTNTNSNYQGNSWGNYSGNNYGGYSNGNYSGNGYASSYTTVTPGQTIRRDAFTTVAIIKMLNKEVKNSYNAELVLQSFPSK